MAVNAVGVAKAVVVSLSVAKITNCKPLVVVHKPIAPLMTTAAMAMVIATAAALLVANAVMQRRVPSKLRAHLVRRAHHVHHARLVTQIVKQRKKLIVKLPLKQFKPIPQLQQVSMATSLQPLLMPRAESAAVAIAILRAANADHASAIRKY